MGVLQEGVGKPVHLDRRREHFAGSLGFTKSGLGLFFDFEVLVVHQRAQGVLVVVLWIVSNVLLSVRLEVFEGGLSQKVAVDESLLFGRGGEGRLL